MAAKAPAAIGLRPINALVDITNFFTYDLNRPLHVFDAAKVKGDLRRAPARRGETFWRWMARPMPLPPAP
jgi:phenylalanyl-tRNA synthetase beta subunit